jgi:hypothetical protein
MLRETDVNGGTRGIFFRPFELKTHLQSEMRAFARTFLIVVLCCHALDVSSAKSLDDQVLAWAAHAAPLPLSVFGLSSIPFFFPFRLV